MDGFAVGDVVRILKEGTQMGTEAVCMEVRAHSTPFSLAGEVTKAPGAGRRVLE